VSYFSVISRNVCERNQWRIGNENSWERNKQALNFRYGHALNRGVSFWKPKERAQKQQAYGMET
jgi:hypothetical protein